MLRIGYPAAASPSADRGDRHRIGFQAGSQDCCYGNARLFLAGSFRVIGWRGAPPGSCGHRQVRSVPLGGSVAFG
jgi:hypothetical protein